MPEMHGIALCRRIRQTELKIPPYIILVTAKVKSSDVVIGLDAGADDYITKPAEPDELHARLRAGKRIRRLQSTLTNRVEELEEAYGSKRYT
jgi:sigma-B regulation protein RsbU (phosphoserine phosphatase)